MFGGRVGVLRVIGSKGSCVDCGYGGVGLWSVGSGGRFGVGLFR